MVPPIIQEPHPTLRSIAKEVALSEIGSQKIQGVIEAMKKALESQDDGVAIAAPQINEPYRIFVVSKKVLSKGSEDTVFINPSIVRLGKKKEYMSEGCLSVRWKYGMVRRATTATVKACTPDGHEFVASGKGLIAQIFQHEIDHLDGVLFIDTAKNIEDLPPESHVRVS